MEKWWGIEKLCNIEEFVLWRFVIGRFSCILFFLPAISHAFIVCLLVCLFSIVSVLSFDVLEKMMLWECTLYQHLNYVD